MDFNNTVKFGLEHEGTSAVREIIKTVCDALSEKGYDPVNQIVGYVMSGDPTYITSHNNARVLITKVDRDDLVEEFVKGYVSEL